MVLLLYCAKGREKKGPSVTALCQPAQRQNIVLFRHGRPYIQEQHGPLRLRCTRSRDPIVVDCVRDPRRTSVYFLCGSAVAVQQYRTCWNRTDHIEQVLVKQTLRSASDPPPPRPIDTKMVPATPIVSWGCRGGGLPCHCSLFPWRGLYRTTSTPTIEVFTATSCVLYLPPSPTLEHHRILLS
jgi:hypothetical protein